MSPWFFQRVHELVNGRSENGDEGNETEIFREENDDGLAICTQTTWI